MDAKHPLTAYRSTKGLTLAKLAFEIGVKPNTVWRWEKGRMPRQREWPKIEKVTGITPAELAAFQAVAA